MKEVKNINESTGSPAEMIYQAINSGKNLEELGKLLDLQERWEAREAKKAYNSAMAEFKKNPPKIEKDKKVGYSTQKGTVGYSHATLANVVEKITSELSKHGLSASWQTQQNGSISVTCRIAHVKGHCEETTLSAPSDLSGSKNPIQAIGSTITYLERYTLLAALGLATHDMTDDDANTVGEKITEKDVNSIMDQLIELDIKESKFNEFMKIDSVENMPASLLPKALSALETKRKSMGEK